MSFILFLGSWGKREPNWNNLKGLWGKRSDSNWGKLSAVWGKRSVEGKLLLINSLYIIQVIKTH